MRTPQLRGLQACFGIEARQGWYQPHAGNTRPPLRDTLDPDVAKRSPILGYNHNVRYRGLVFHVQTEDSGLLTPHLFTHLFHGGVIISTRKLVYDAGSAEDSIKSLMQAQHKAVLKDLKKGSFDDKIEQYLAGTPGLLPRGADESDERPDIMTPPAGQPPVPQPPVVAAARAPKVEAAPGSLAAKTARTRTAERGSAPSAVRTNLPPSPPSADELGGPTLDDNEARSIAAAIAAANARVPTQLPSDEPATIPVEMPHELSPLEIELELDEPDELPRRSKHDTDIAVPAELELGRTSTKRAPGEAVLPATQSQPRASSSVGAATLKPPISRPPSRPAISPPQVVSRPVASADRRNDDAVEVYAPPPPGVDAPPGLAGSERPGQYSQHKRASQKMPTLEIANERSGAAASIPPGLGRPARISSSPVPASAAPRSVGPPATPPSRQTGPAGIVPASGGPTAAREQASGTQRARTPTPARVSSAPPAAARTSSASGGVVMTRPAVIVGAPTKPNPQQRVRKAREEEGRGFGQGLISEKSLDEVILAYLSEDADEK